jgi:peptide/nickel transport system substrate-binding protein
LDHAKRAAILAKMQHLLDEHTMYVPIWQLAFISGVGPRVDNSGFGLIRNYVYTAPYEDITLKST